MHSPGTRYNPEHRSGLLKALPDITTLHYRINVPNILWHLPYLQAIMEHNEQTNKIFPGRHGSSHGMKLCIGMTSKTICRNILGLSDAQLTDSATNNANDNLGRLMTEYTHYNLPVSFALSFP